MEYTRTLILTIGLSILFWSGAPIALAQGPDHPVITEVFTNPVGLMDGPVGRDPANLHQEYIEIYLPPAADLDFALNPDALNLTFYEVEGDFTSSGVGLVNYRIDLPTFDLDPSNGLTFGAIARPPSGAVVIGWVDYVGNPPTDLAGTPSTRVALIDGGITSATDFVFIALNGAQFSGTTNFPAPLAISFIDMPSEASSGMIQNGSGAYLLVNRDDFGYVELFDDKHIPFGGSADPSLATGTVLGVSAMLDGFAGNDHAKFDVLLQPYAAPTGNDIDLENELILGGAFSLIVPQVDYGKKHGFARLFVDVVKTSEDGILFNEDPVVDALGAYRTITNVGPLFPTPGRVHFTDSPPELAVADPIVQMVDVLTGTTGRPGIVCANAGGHFGMQVSGTMGTSSNPAVATVGIGDPATVVTGQTPVYPQFVVTVPSGVVDGSLATASATLDAINTMAGDPPVVNPNGSTTLTIRAIDPMMGQDALLMPFQATAFAAVQGIPNDPAVMNEFLSTSLSQFVADNLGGIVDDERHNGALLLNPMADLSNPALADAMEDDMPTDPLLFINPLSPAGLDDLVTTVANSAEEVFGLRTYKKAFNNAMTALAAVELNIAETFTSGGVFVPTERVYYASPTGAVAVPNSGLSDVNTTRGFELALLDTNVQQFGTLETGNTDDFGLVVEVGQVGVGATVVPGEFVFLSYTGGFEGADIDSVDVPPHDSIATVIYFDLDPLATVLGCETITRLFVIDGNGGSSINIIEAFSLNAATLCACKGDVNQDGLVNGGDIQGFVDQVLFPGDPLLLPAACASELSGDGFIGAEDVPLMLNALMTGTCAPLAADICGCKGDMNFDGLLNGEDIQGFIDQLLLPGDPSVDPVACAADLNGNGIISLGDVPFLLNAMFNFECPPGP